MDKSIERIDFIELLDKSIGRIDFVELLESVLPFVIILEERTSLIIRQCTTLCYSIQRIYFEEL